MIDLQISKSGDEVTINAGVLDPEVFARCWGDPPGFPVDETSCTVRARVGQLMTDRKDLWWSIEDAGTPEQVAEALDVAVVPFLESMHSREAMIAWLQQTGVTRQGYPPPIIYLAILLHLSGDTTGACSVVGVLRRNALGAWRDRIGVLFDELGCSET